MRIAFYAPMKPPDHPTPSGDRRVARLLMAALAEAGHEVFLADDFRGYEGTGERQRQQALARQGAQTAERLVRDFQAQKQAPPDLWFTYHLYHKAPDWLGPEVAAALQIPYVVAEASFAPKQAGGPWDLGHRAVARAIAAAAAVFCLTRLDMACVEPLLGGPDKLHYLPPFIDTETFDATPERERSRKRLARRLALDPALPWLVTVAMMRPGDKLESYRRLGAALARLEAPEWQLLVVGDGEAAEQVHAALAPLGDRVSYAGELASERLPEIYVASDICVWPAANEAYGVALLEAEAAGLPVVAGGGQGIPDVVIDGETGLLTEDGDADAFAGAVSTLLAEAPLRHRLGAQARAMVRRERTLAATARRLDRVLEGLAP